MHDRRKITQEFTENLQRQRERDGAAAFSAAKKAAVLAAAAWFLDSACCLDGPVGGGVALDPGGGDGGAAFSGRLYRFVDRLQGLHGRFLGLGVGGFPGRFLFFFRLRLGFFGGGRIPYLECQLSGNRIRGPAVDKLTVPSPSPITLQTMAVLARRLSGKM